MRGPTHIQTALTHTQGLTYYRHTKFITATYTSLSATGLMDELSFQFAALKHHFTGGKCCCWSLGLYQRSKFSMPLEVMTSNFTNHSTVCRSPVCGPPRLPPAACVFEYDMNRAGDANRQAVLKQYSQMLLFNLIRPLADKVAPQGIM